jgi:uncharacterized OB-fold protein
MTEPTFNHTGYRHWLEQGKLMATRCQSCGTLSIPPRQLCPACFDRNMIWHPLSGLGHLQAFTAVYVAPSKMIAAGYSRENPYYAGIVQLEEGPSISAQILGLDPSQPDRVSLGIPMRAAFVQRDEGEEKNTYLAFEPA